MSPVVSVRAVRVSLPTGSTTWTVVDNDGRTIEAADTFLNTYLAAKNASSNTVEAYARHLALFFRWLETRGAPWQSLTFEGLCTFANDLRDGTLRSLTRVGTYRIAKPRSRATVEAALAAVYGFLRYWQIEGQGPSSLQLYQEASRSGRSSYSFLAHIESRRAGQERRLRVRGPKASPPMLIGFEEDFSRLCHAAHTARDRTLLSAMFDGGLRISQALGLRHGDLDIARQRVTIVRRADNPNGAISKQRITFTVDMPSRFFEFYADSLVNEQLLLGVDSDFVFVNLQHPTLGRPMSYSNARQIVQKIGHRAGLDLTPHTLRHTHATALAKQGWTAPQIAARLGQSAPTSADIYIHLAHDDISTKYRMTFPAKGAHAH
jgi:site-specific recombinase XerD